MRKISFIMLSVVAFALASCSGSSSNNENGSSAAKQTEKQEVVGNAVDLGLSVKWADHNVGAQSAGDFGGFYFWGDVKGNLSVDETKQLYAELNAKSICGIDKYDVATAKWGGKWRMPTTAEIKELCDKKKCMWTWKKEGNVYGYSVTGPNGNSIFLPAAGCKEKNSDKELGVSGYYWGGETTEKGNPQLMFFRNGMYYESYAAKNTGMNIRPVQ